MKFGLVVKTGVVFAGIVLAIISLLNIGVFVIEVDHVSKSIAYTNVLLSVLIMIQISVLIMLINIYEKGGAKK